MSKNKMEKHELLFKDMIFFIDVALECGSQVKINIENQINNSGGR